MQWAFSDNTNVGDTTILNRKGKEFVLVEATESGYIEIASGKYDYVRDINEQIYRKQTFSSRVHSEKYRSQEGRDRWDTVNVGDRENGRRIDDESGEEKLQNNTSGNDESIRSGDKKSDHFIKN